MYSFFVLGFIPGTNFQITFQVWLDSLLLLIEVMGITWLYRRHHQELARYIPPQLVLAWRLYYGAYATAFMQFKAFFLSQTTTTD